MFRYVHVYYRKYLSGVFPGLVVDSATRYSNLKELRKAERVMKPGTTHADAATGGEYTVLSQNTYPIKECPSAILERHGFQS